MSPRTLALLVACVAAAGVACRSGLAPLRDARLMCDGDQCGDGSGGSGGNPPLKIDTLRFASCAVATIFQFDVDGVTYTTPSTSWYLGAHVEMKIPTSPGSHLVDMVRWEPTAGERRDSVTTGVPYQLPCP